jgi:hypothetical protein
MAGSRRGRSKGFPGGELRGTLGGLLRSALGQAGVVRDALERGAREGRARLDDARLERQRADALADLGEAVLDAVRRGALADLEDLPEIAQAVAAIEDLDARLEDHGDRRRGREDWVAAPRRQRFDHSDTPWQRVRDEAHGDPDVGDPDVGDAEVEEPRRRGAGDGTVSSAEWRPPRPAAPQRVWRPTDTGEETAVDRPAQRRRPEPRPDARPDDAKDEPRPPKRPAPRAGGISFAEDEDEDLRDYMHPDDVPPRDRDKK